MSSLSSPVSSPEIGLHSRKCYHLSFGKNVTRINLFKTNKNRDYRIFEEFA